MKKKLVVSLFIIYSTGIFSIDIPPVFAQENMDSSVIVHTSEQVTSDDLLTYRLKIPKKISSDNLGKVFGSCVNCEAISRLITKNDVAELERLPLIVNKTIKEITKYKKGRYEDSHKITVKLTNGEINNNFKSALRTGERICQVYDFSFLWNSVQLVGTHRCLVERFNGEMSIFKFTGNRLFATLKPYKESAFVFIGRSYISEHQQQRYDRENPNNIENDNFGNNVGYAFSIDNKLVLLSVSQRGFTEPDSTYFQCLVIK